MRAFDPAWLPLLRELGELKRIRSAQGEGSVAQRLFAGGWTALAAGEDAATVMRRTVAAALAAVRLGDLDRATLRALGLDEAAALAVLERSFCEVTALVEPALAADLRGGLAAGAPTIRVVPAFVPLLLRQPRAGVTCPGLPRLMLQPAEDHGEHCLIVAVYGVLAAPALGADPAEVFVAGMAHHLHNAAMPDAGYAGEILLGEHLDTVITASREKALAQLPAPVAVTVRAALAPIAGDATAAARAFHAADVIDRVLEIEQHLRVRAVGMDEVLGTYGLVHDGAVQAFHHRVLADVGLAELGPSELGAA